MAAQIKSPKVFICIPVHNRVELTLECLKSIYGQSYRNFQVIICNDGSTDNSETAVKEKYPDVIILEGDGNLWWTGSMNRCVKRALELAGEEDFIYTLNNDTVLRRNSLSCLVSNASQNTIICSLNVFYNNPEKIERSAFRKTRITKRLISVTKWGEKINGRKGLFEITTCSGKGVLLPVKVFKNVGLYDETNLPHYHADIELVHRAKQNGYKIMVSFDSVVLSHQELSGIGTITSKPNVIEFVKSFGSLKSTHHVPSLVNYHKLIYGKLWRIYLGMSLMFIVLGFIKRLIQGMNSKKYG